MVSHQCQTVTMNQMFQLSLCDLSANLYNLDFYNLHFSQMQGNLMVSLKKHWWYRGMETLNTAGKCQMLLIILGVQTFLAA